MRSVWPQHTAELAEQEISQSTIIKTPPSIFSCPPATSSAVVVCRRRVSERISPTHDGSWRRRGGLPCCCMPIKRIPTHVRCGI